MNHYNLIWPAHVNLLSSALMMSYFMRNAYQTYWKPSQSDQIKNLLPILENQIRIICNLQKDHFNKMKINALVLGAMIKSPRLCAVFIMIFFPEMGQI